MDIRRFFGVQPSKSVPAETSKKSDGGGKASEVGEQSGKGKKRSKESNDKRRKSSKTSESDETPTKKSESRKQSKKRRAVIESDSSGEEPLPPKLRKPASKPSRKRKVIPENVLSSDEEAAVTTKPQKPKKNEEPSKPNAKESASVKSPVKVIANFSEYFGNKPVERSFRKSHASKRKERCEEDVLAIDNQHAAATSSGNINGSTKKPSTKSIILDSAEQDTVQEQPVKKLKKSSSDVGQGGLQSGARETDVSKTEKARETSLKQEKTEATSTSSSKSSKDKAGKSAAKMTEGKSICQTKTSPIKSKENDSGQSENLKPRKSIPATSSPSKSKIQTAAEISKNDIPVSTSVTPLKSTPSKVTESGTPDVLVPSSLERKASGYRSFMAREGPKALGLKEIPKGSEDCLAGLVFVVTGVLESIEREEAQDLIRRHGGKVTQSLSKKTTYIVVGREPGESKVEKAKTFGTKKLDEDGLFDLIRKSEKSTSTPERASKPVKEKIPSSASTAYNSESQRSLDMSPSQKYSQASTLSSARSSPATQTPAASPLAKDVDKDSLLWVDKYCPKETKHIIGQRGDKSNVKKLTRWLQSWHENQKSGKSKGGYFAGKEDGSIFKAALLSGPPGVGKTTSAQLVCKESGYSFVEFNASDSRSKKTLQQCVSEVLGNKTMDSYLKDAGPQTSGEKHVLVMDEVDGMAGNEDRGGMQELISLIKTTKIPIICMCNDRNSQKIRSLANYCFDLRFHRPKIDQIKGAMMSLAYKENLQISPQAMERIIVGANHDVRQVIHNLCMWTSKQKSLNYDEAKADAAKAHKDIKLGPFDVTRMIFSSEESSKMSMQEYFSLFFNDYSLIPLFSQENYLNAVPYSAGGDIKKTLKCVSEAADSFCDSDLVDKCIRSNGSWNLLPLQSFFSCVLPGKIMKGRLGQRIDFPSWLGKHSTTGKNSRILQELLSHAELSISGSKLELNLDYIPHLRNVLTRPLIDATSENCSAKVSEVIQLMDSYHFMKEDWENVLEVGQYPGKPKLQSQIETKVKSAFTRTYNKESHLAPYSSQTTAKKNRAAATMATNGANLDEMAAGDQAANSEDSEDDNIEKNAMIKVKKTIKGKKGSATTTSKTQASKAGSRGKGTGKGKGKTK